MFLAGEATECDRMVRGPRSRAETAMSRWGMGVGGGWVGSGAADEAGDCKQRHDATKRVGVSVDGRCRGVRRCQKRLCPGQWAGCRRVRICESDGLQKREIGEAGLVGLGPGWSGGRSFGSLVRHSLGGGSKLPVEALVTGTA